jgi:hypothetical protein
MNDVRQLNWIKAKMILPNDCMDVDWSDVPPQRAAKAARCPTKAEDGRKPHERRAGQHRGNSSSLQT